ncbi:MULTISPECIES: LuxR C-terminal-related transcriptional regulator [unclassified Kitasatospora]|uniref:helix-turn-helix transcriptional regulator n=1 Tax=unclassified Kitasatospora TaxID=2633591 RepID=UPI00070B460C|nr:MULTISPECIES: LuxR C-terminal-related transcriptional regulator [unclassified Kitasatospora]KQV20843.1 hypothetical protein ASC99_20250 [Kitasatospora sp. Root107]KRB60501.1 hypothetical protein ASE03_12925 [Kitasatospora sp. Root187]
MPTTATITDAPLAPPADLTATDVRLLRLLAGGAGNARLCAALGESEYQITQLVHGLLERTCARGRMQAATLSVVWGVAQAEHVHPDGRPVMLALSPRQLTLLQGWVAGRSNDDLAAECGVTASTIRGYRQPLLDKLATSSNVQAGCLGVLYDLVTLDHVHPALPPLPLSQWTDRPQLPADSTRPA